MTSRREEKVDKLVVNESLIYQGSDLSQAINSKQDAYILGSSSTATGTTAKIVTLDNPTYTPVAGDMFLINFTTANSASAPTLNINSSGAFPLTTPGGTGANIAWTANTTIQVYFTGTEYRTFAATSNSNTTYSVISEAEINSGATTARTITGARGQYIADLRKIDEDDFASNSDTQWPTQQSVKAYVDNGLSGKTSTSVKISTGAGLNGGGDLTSDRTISLNIGASPVNAVSLAGANLNSIIDPGFYTQTLPGTASTALNYPITASQGSLEVANTSGSGVFHRYTDNVTSRTWLRNYNGSVWSAWKEVLTTDTEFKTVNGEAILGSGNIVVSGGQMFIPATCTTAAATNAKVVTVNGNPSYTPVAGDIFAILFTLGNSGTSPTININGSGAVSLRPAGATTGVAITANFTVFVYWDGTRYVMFGSSTDNNTTYTAITEANILNGASTTAGLITGQRAEAVATKYRSDETGLVSNSDVLMPTQRAVKEYVDTADASKMSKTGDVATGDFEMREAGTKYTNDTGSEGFDVRYDSATQMLVFGFFS